MCGEVESSLHKSAYSTRPDYLRGKDREPVKKYVRKNIYLDVPKYIEFLKEIREDAYADILRAFRKSTTEDMEKGRAKPYWWNVEVEEARGRYIRLRRRYTRCRDKEERPRIREDMEEQGKKVKKLIKDSKKRRWENILAELENDNWGEGYKIVTGQPTSGKPGFQIPVKKRKEILQELFPMTIIKRQ